MDPVKVVPARNDGNIIVAAFNIKWLGNTPHDLDKLATVIQHFDVCGVLEVKAEEELPRLAKSLEALTSYDWGYVFGTRTHRPGGSYHEAYGFLYRHDRVYLGNGIVSNIWDKSETYRNDPYVASFRRKSFDFAMALLHTRWSDDIEGSREEEVQGVADQIRWMKEFIPEDDLLLAGDFNYSGTANPMLNMASYANLQQLDNNAKSTFKLDGTGFASSYDHIYVGAHGKGTLGRLIGTCTTLDTCHLVYGDNDPSNMLLAKEEISDHLPVFAEFAVD
jgi:endonuclease/exonuclease/phosphatase family metal-dependent hydrolase